MKKIEALIKRSNRSSIINELKKLDYVIIMNVQNIADNAILNVLQNNKKYSKSRSIQLSKLEIVVPEKYLKKVYQIIIKYSGLSVNTKQKSIFVTTVKMAFAKDKSTNQDDYPYNADIEYLDTKKQTIRLPVIKRNRMIPLQQITITKTLSFYERYKKTLQSKYRINSYSSFINYCIQEYISINGRHIKHGHNPAAIDTTVNYAYQQR